MQGKIIIIDFGLGILKNEKKSFLPTSAGTLEYFPPEVLIRAKIDYTVDFWGLGILMFEMLFGKTPFID
jgi:serine/threonine protein kinase